MNSQAATGLVLNIQHFCTNDGPGIRTTVFLKGCSLRCKWCCNPESIGRKPELAYNVDKCIGKKACGRCLAPPVPEGDFYVLDGPDDRVRVNWDLAAECGVETTSVCPTGALYMFGQGMTVEEVLDEVEQDSAFYDQSGGGVTLSGGESCCNPISVRRCSPGRMSAASTRRSKRPATSPGSSWKGSSHTLTSCCTITS